MAPDGSLSYSSDSTADGPLGVGWSVNLGQSVIRRCARTHAVGVKATVSGVRTRKVDGIHFDATDALCLDGELLDLQAGKYGEPGSEYRTIVDSHVKIVATGGGGGTPAGFTAYFKDGRVASYVQNGLDDDGKALEGVTLDDGSKVAAVWALASVADRSGNTIEYAWSTYSRSAEPVLTKVTYTSCKPVRWDSDEGPRTTCPYGTAASHTIFLRYDTTGASPVAYRAGAKFEHVGRLTGIEMDALWSYNFRYRDTKSAQTNRTLLEGVSWCASGKCRSKQFRWADTPSEWREWELPGVRNVVTAEASGLNASENAFVLADIDGDGHQDLIFKDWPTVALESDGRLKARLDGMGSGPQDYLAMGDGTGGFKTPVRLDIDGSGPAADAAAERCGPLPSKPRAEIADLSAVDVVDLDQDGRAELYVPINRGCPYSWTQGGNTQAPRGIRPVPEVSLKGVSEDASTAASNRTMAVLGYSNGGLAPRSLVGLSGLGWGRTRTQFGDMNGDGLPDLVQADQNGHYSVFRGMPFVTEEDREKTLRVAVHAPFSTGLWFQWRDEPGGRTPRDVRLIDRDGNGRTELVQYTLDGGVRALELDATGTRVKRTLLTPTGSGGATTREEVLALGEPSKLWPGYPQGTTLPSEESWYAIDINGDGLQDGFYPKANGAWYYRINTGRRYLDEQAVGQVSALRGYAASAVLRLNAGSIEGARDNGLRIADMNGDALPDLVLLGANEASAVQVLYNTGNCPNAGACFADAVALPAHGARLMDSGNQKYLQTQLADIDGDGSTELVEWVSGSKAHTRVLKVVRREAGRDVITEVHDTQAPTLAERVTYNDLSAPGVHRQEAGNECGYPVSCAAGGLVVTAYDNLRSSRKVSNTYTYAGMRTDVAGGGFLGFRRVESRDTITGSTTTELFDQTAEVDVGATKVGSTYRVYAKRSAPAKVIVERPKGAPRDSSLSAVVGKDVSTSVSNTWTFAPSLPLRLSRFEKVVVTNDVGEGVASVRLKESETLAFDDYGNVTSRSTIASEGAPFEEGAKARTIRASETNEYEPADTEKWFVAQLKSTTSTATDEDAACLDDACRTAYARKTTYVYETEGTRRLLKEVHVEPDRTGAEALAMTRVVVLERDRAGLVRRTRVSDANGVERVSEDDYDATGTFPRTHRNAVGHVSYSSWNARGYLAATTDANGAWVKYSGDPFGSVYRTQTSTGSWSQTTVVGLAGKDSSARYGVLRQNSAMGTETGFHQSMSYMDERGRPVLVVEPGSPKLNSSGQPEIDGTVATVSAYDALGLPVATTAYRLKQSVDAILPLLYPEMEKTVLAASPESLSRASHDVLGRPTSHVAGAAGTTTSGAKTGHTTTFSYPRVGVVVETDEANNVTSRYQDGYGSARRVYHGTKGNRGEAISMSYNALGLLETVEAPGVPTERFQYDAFGRRVAWDMGGSGNLRTTGYNGFGEIVDSGESSAYSVHVEVDGLGRTTRRSVSSGTASEGVVHYEWDTAPLGDGKKTALGRLASVEVESGHRVTYAYDQHARLSQTTNHFAFADSRTQQALAMAYAYDAEGRPTSILYPSVRFGNAKVAGLTVVNRYVAGQLLSASSTTAGFSWTAAERDAHDRLTRVKLGNGVDETAVYTPSIGRLEGLKVEGVRNGASKSDVQVQFGYKPNGKLGSRITSDGTTETYDYDGSVGGHLTDYSRTISGASNKNLSAVYRYDASSGELEGIQSSYPSGRPADWNPAASFALGSGSGGANVASGYGDLLTTMSGGPDGPVSIAYDTAGREVAQTYTATGKVRRELGGFNTYNLPTSVTVRGEETVLQYDGTGTRVLKRNPRATLRYIDRSVEIFRPAADDSDQSAPPADSSVLYRIYVAGSPVAEITQRFDGSASTISYLHTDRDGSVVYRTNGDGTAAGPIPSEPARIGGYHPFGGRRYLNAAPAPSSRSAFSSIGYTGHIHDDDLGLINMKGRLYDPEEHRFVSRDPFMLAGAHGGTSAYAYVLNDPMNHADPTGYECSHIDQSGNSTCGDTGWPTAAWEVTKAVGRGMCKLFGGCKKNTSSAPPSRPAASNPVAGEYEPLPDTVQWSPAEPTNQCVGYCGTAERIFPRISDDVFVRTVDDHDDLSPFNIKNLDRNVQRDNLQIQQYGLTDSSRQAVINVNGALREVAQGINASGDPTLKALYHDMIIKFDATPAIKRINGMAAAATAVWTDNGQAQITFTRKFGSRASLRHLTETVETAFDVDDPVFGHNNDYATFTVLHEIGHLMDATREAVKADYVRRTGSAIIDEATYDQLESAADAWANTFMNRNMRLKHANSCIELNACDSRP